MNGIVLGAGRGTRLTPFTDDRPKCLIEIDGITLLERQVHALRYAGADPVRVVVGWRGDQVSKRGFATIDNPRWHETTMVSSLRCAAQSLRQAATLVSYGDIIYSRETAARLAQCTQPIVIAYDPDWLQLWSRRFADPLSDAETFSIDADGVVRDIGRRPSSLEDVQGQYMGLLRFTPEAWQEAERVLDQSDVQLDMTGLLRQIITAGRIPVHAIPAIGPWCEIDHPLDIPIATAISMELDREQSRPLRG
jgi:choline kinase